MRQQAFLTGFAAEMIRQGHPLHDGIYLWVLEESGHINQPCR